MSWEKSIPGMERLILEMVAARGLVQGESIEPIDPVHSRRRGRDQGTQAQTGLIFVKASLEGFEERDPDPAPLPPKRSLVDRL